MEALLLSDLPAPGITLSRLASLVNDSHAQGAQAEVRLKKAKKKHAQPADSPAGGGGLDSGRVGENAESGNTMAGPTTVLGADSSDEQQDDRRSPPFEITLNPREHKAEGGGVKTCDAVGSPPAPAKAAPKSRVSFRPKEEKPAWDGRKSKPQQNKAEPEQATGSPESSPPRIRVPQGSKVSQKAGGPNGAAGAAPTSARPEMDTGTSAKAKARKASLAGRASLSGVFGALSASAVQLGGVQRAAHKMDAAEMRRLEDMLAKVREAVEAERQAMAAERAASEASCAGVLERAAHSWLRIWQVQRVYAGSKEAALLGLPWRGHLSFPFLHWKKTAQQKAQRRRQRRKADLEYKRTLFKRWRQAGQLSAGMAASVSAFERRRWRSQQRGTLRSWRALIDDRKTAHSRLRQCVQRWQAGRLHQAWQRWREGVEVQQSKKARLARARRHVQGILVRAAFSEWRGLVCVSAHAREVMRNSSERLQQRGLLRAFRGWREAVAEVQRQRAIMQRAAGHIMHSALAQAFSAWVAKTQLQQAVRRFAALLRNRVQLSAFNTWRSAVHEGRQMEQDLHQVFAHRREAFAGEMLSRWRAWRSGGVAPEGGSAGALRWAFRKWRARLGEKRQLRQHARRLAKQRTFRQWAAHTRWAKNLQATTLQRRAFDRWNTWTSVRMRGKSLATLEAALASSEQRSRDLRAQLQAMQDERDAANQRGADLVAAVRSLDWKLQSAAKGQGASPPRSPRVHPPAPTSQGKPDPRARGVMSRPNERVLEV